MMCTMNVAIHSHLRDKRDDLAYSSGRSPEHKFARMIAVIECRGCAVRFRCAAAETPTAHDLKPEQAVRWSTPKHCPTPPAPGKNVHAHKVSSLLAARWQNARRTVCTPVSQHNHGPTHTQPVNTHADTLPTTPTTTQTQMGPPRGTHIRDR